MIDVSRILDDVRSRNQIMSYFDGKVWRFLDRRFIYLFFCFWETSWTEKNVFRMLHLKLKVVRFLWFLHKMFDTLDKHLPFTYLFNECSRTTCKSNKFAKTETKAPFAHENRGKNTICMLLIVIVKHILLSFLLCYHNEKTVFPQRKMNLLWKY